MKVVIVLSLMVVGLAIALHLNTEPEQGMHRLIKTDGRVTPESLRDWNRRYPNDPITAETTGEDLIKRMVEREAKAEQP